MKGQWIGVYSGTNSGTIIVNIDEKRDCFEGCVYLKEDNEKLLGTTVLFTTKSKGQDFHFSTSGIYPTDPRNGLPIFQEELRKKIIEEKCLENVPFSKKADVSGHFDDFSLKLEWSTDIGVSGSTVIQKSQADQPSKLCKSEMDWGGFKNHVLELEKDQFLFRGQNKPWRLRTSFHRYGRANLYRFLQEDIQILHRHLSARTKHVFDLGIPNENGAFFNLVQHHGYPTPLLDWTYSPYVAAFFSYRGLSNQDTEKSSSENKVRVLVFDQAQWEKDFG